MKKSATPRHAMWLLHRDAGVLQPPIGHLAREPDLFSLCRLWNEWYGVATQWHSNGMDAIARTFEGSMVWLLIVWRRSRGGGVL